MNLEEIASNICKSNPKCGGWGVALYGERVIFRFFTTGKVTWYYMGKNKPDAAITEYFAQKLQECTTREVMQLDKREQELGPKFWEYKFDQRLEMVRKDDVSK